MRAAEPEWRTAGAWRILVAGAWTAAVPPERAVRDLGALPEGAEAIVPPGRHRVDRVRLAWGPGGKEIDAAVKTYGRQSGWRDAIARRKGTKAARAFATACRLAAAGIGTPEPIAVMERWEGGRLLESRFVSRFVPGLSDFRVELNRLFSAETPRCADIMSLLETVAAAVRGMHDAGVLHRDLGNQNIGLLPAEGGGWRAVFLDLNRAVRVEEASEAARGRDMSRLDIPSDFRRCFFAMYHGGWNPPKAFRDAERKARAAFDRHTRLRPWRHPIREARIRRAEAGMARPPSGRELWVWDDRSAQPVPAYTSKDRRRFIAPGNVWDAVAAGVSGGAALRRALREAEASPGPAVPVPEGLGISLEPDVATWAEQRRWLARLSEEGGRKPPVQLRLYHHAGEAGWRRTCAAARELREAGHPVALALVQSRRAVRDPASWAAMVRLAGEELAGVAEAFHALHAPNRTKWGVWDYRRELPGLFGPLRELRERCPEARIYAPGCIDFEPHSLAAVLRHVPGDIGFAGLSHALYVDRRGAPENRQGGFDTVRKCALLRAFSGCQPGMGGEVVLTEANWPLAETGVWSPVTSPYETLDPRKNDPSVTEEVYADYMRRYVRLALGSGHVRRLYWWRLAAHGFGLVDVPPDGGPWRARPAFGVFAGLLRGE
jgi:hypothetical protein